MPIFALKVPVATREPTVLVEGELAPGEHTFQLVVEDNDGHQSAPARRTVAVREPAAPPAPPP